MKMTVFGKIFLILYKLKLKPVKTKSFHMLVFISFGSLHIVHALQWEVKSHVLNMFLLGAATLQDDLNKY